MRAKYAIWDLDNCLFDDKWRAHLIEWDKEGNERYRRYNERMEEDPVCNKQVFDVVGQYAIPVFFTGRSEEFRAPTMRRLQSGLGQLSPLIFFRGQEETLTPADLKQRMLRLFLQRVSAIQIVGAFDDLPAVIEMYRKHGIPAARLAINTDDYAYQPSDLVSATTTI